MKNNPHEQTIVDEASGIEVANQRWQDREDGYEEGFDVAAKIPWGIDTSKLTVMGNEEIICENVDYQLERTVAGIPCVLRESEINIDATLEAQLHHTIKELEGEGWK